MSPATQDWIKMKHDEERKPMDTQVGGDHYQYPIQPLEFIHANNIPFIEANVIKYVMRWREKNGKQDLLKARDYIEKLIALEFKED